MVLNPDDVIRVHYLDGSIGQIKVQDHTTLSANKEELQGRGAMEYFARTMVDTGLIGKWNKPGAPS